MMKVCIVGYGAIGPVHAEAVAAIDGAELYAICDCNREVADAAAREHQVKAFYDYNLCLKDKEIEGAIRFSFSEFNTQAEMEYTLEKVKQAVARFRKLGSFR